MSKLPIAALCAAGFLLLWTMPSRADDAIKLPIPGPKASDDQIIIVITTPADDKTKRHIKITYIEKKKETTALDETQEVSYQSDKGESIWNTIHVYCPEDDPDESKKPKDKQKKPYVKIGNEKSSILADAKQQKEIKDKLKKLFGKP
jgi:hypothetical protein